MRYMDKQLYGINLNCPVCKHWTIAKIPESANPENYALYDMRSDIENPMFIENLSFAYFCTRNSTRSSALLDAHAYALVSGVTYRPAYSLQGWQIRMLCKYLSARQQTA